VELIRAALNCSLETTSNGQAFWEYSCTTSFLGRGLEVERLRQRDFLLVNRCVQEIYTPSTLETLPAYILSILSKAVPSEVPACSKINFQSCRVSITCPPLDLLHVKHIERIAHHHFHEHPVVSNFLRSGDGQAYKISDFISESQFH